MSRSIARRVLPGVAALAALAAACESATPTASPPASPSPAVSPSPVGTLETPQLPKCDYPPKVRFPEWVPKDLPLPDKTYAMQRLAPLSGYKRALFVVRVTLEELTAFVLSEWPKKGWVLGRGDSEPGEIEDHFSKAPSVGAFKAQSVFCDPGYSVMYLIYAPKRPNAPGVQLTPSPQGSPLLPSPAAT